ncbi:hypothetical protein ACET3Z_019208 [Daucus carota]
MGSQLNLMPIKSYSELFSAFKATSKCSHTPGPEASIFNLIDFIDDAQMAKADDISRSCMMEARIAAFRNAPTARGGGYLVKGLLDHGADGKHWIIWVKKPEGNPTRDEIIKNYVNILAHALGSFPGLSVYSCSAVLCYVYLDSEMDSDLNVSIMFLKPLIFFPRGTLPERLRLPRGFVDHFGESLPELLNLKTMEGFNFSVKYSNEDGCISDMHGLLANLLPKEFQFMLFKYLGGANFEVFILDVGCVLQGIPGRNNSFQCMFIRIFGKDSSEWTPLKLSEDFIDKFGNQVPSGIRYLLTDGTLVSGSFDSGNGTIRGLQKVYRFYNVSIFDIMVFTYTGGDVFAVHAFGKHCMPKRSCKDPGLYFEVEIKQSHLQDYDFGVTVPVKFKAATKNIGEAGTLKIQHGERRWNVVLKKRTNRVELHRGWSVLWKDLDLMTGDICVFNNAGSKLKFNLEVYRKSI